MVAVAARRCLTAYGDLVPEMRSLDSRTVGRSPGPLLPRGLAVPLLWGLMASTEVGGRPEPYFRELDERSWDVRWGIVRSSLERRMIA